MEQRFWISRDGRVTWVEVSKAEFVRVERAAGFRNTLNQPDEPATAAFGAADGLTYGTVFDPHPLFKGNQS